MSIEDVIQQFCSRYKAQREQRGNARVPEITGCSQCSQPKTSKEDLILVEFVKKCCIGFDVDPINVIDGMLDEDNKQEIIRGEISEEAMRLFIKSWITGK